MHEFKTGTKIFYDHLGRPHERPDTSPVLWRPSVYAVATYGHRILVVEATCTPGVWTLPGGGVEPHESMFDGLRRECREELGFDLEIQPQAPLYFAEYSFYFEWTGEYLHSLVHVFAGRAPGDMLVSVLPRSPDFSEILRLSWIDPCDLDEAICHFTLWPFIRELGR